MIYRVLLAEQAKRDLRGIYEYLAICFTQVSPEYQLRLSAKLRVYLSEADSQV